MEGSSSWCIAPIKQFDPQSFSSSDTSSENLIRRSLLSLRSGSLGNIDGERTSSSTREWLKHELIPARLAACGKCDQLIAGQCTFTGRLAVTLAEDLTSCCPIGLWPGEIPHKWLTTTTQPRFPTKPSPCKVLLTFPHGFGDHVQLTTVLLHLKRYQPQLELDIACRAGCESLFRGLCRRAFPIGQGPAESYDISIPLWWHEPSETYQNSPSTKAEKCLREVFRMTPDPSLCRYACDVSPENQTVAAAYLRRMNATNRAVLIHYQGRCGRDLKDLPDSAISRAIETVRRAGCVPLMLDWDGNSALVSKGEVANVGADRELWPDGFGDAARLASLAAQSRLCIGIDSGPGHLFGAVQTPSLIVWKYLHPVNYFGLADHVAHLVPPGHGRFIRGDRVTGERYFHASYNYRQYSNIDNDLALAVEEALNRG